MKEYPILWGVRGNLKALAGCVGVLLPLMEFGGGGIFGALENHWSFGDKNSLNRVMPLNRQAVGRWATKLEMLFELPVRSGQLVAVMGPDFKRSLDILTESEMPAQLPNDWFPAQGNFLIRLDFWDAIQKTLKILAKFALEIFDEELKYPTEEEGKNLSDFELSTRAKHARVLFLENPSVSPLDLFLREAIKILFENEEGGEIFREHLKSFAEKIELREKELLKKLKKYVCRVGYGKVLAVPDYPLEPCESE
jgi:hypothetical protein